LQPRAHITQHFQDCDSFLALTGKHR
jgi:hypothetical protein